MYTQVLDGSLREAVDKVGGELITIVHKTGKENSGPQRQLLKVACQPKLGRGERPAFAEGYGGQPSPSNPERRLVRPA